MSPTSNASEVLPCNVPVPATDEIDTSQIASRHLWLASPPSELQESLFSGHCGLGHCSRVTVVPGPGPAGQMHDCTRQIPSDGRVIVINITINLSLRSRAGRKRQSRDCQQQRGRDTGSIRHWAFMPEGRDGGPQRGPVYLLGRILGLLIHQSIPPTFDLDTGPHVQDRVENPWSGPCRT